MKHANTITAILLISLFIGGTAAQTQQQQTDPDAEQLSATNIDAILINTDPVPVQSGEDAEINFKLRNTGSSNAEDVKVQLMDSFPFQVKPDRKVNYSLGEIAKGEEYQISTEVLVADNAPDGRNSFKIKIIRDDISYTRDIPVQVQSQDIELNLANLKTTPTSLTPDTEDAKMNIELVNNGEKTGENTVLNLGLPEGFEETSSFSTRQALGNIAPGEVKTAEFTFDINEDAEPGTLQIPANISYSTGDSSNQITEETSFSFNLAGKPQFKVVSTSSDLKAGSNEEMRVTVKNTGSKQSSSTRIRVLDSSDQPFSYSSSSQYIGTLEPGQNGTAVFDITAENSAEAKQYLIDFEIRGVKDTEVFTEDTTLPLEVNKTQQSSGSSLPLIAALILVLGGGAYFFRDRITKKKE